MKVGQPNGVLPPEPPAKPTTSASAKRVADRTSLSSAVDAAKTAVQNTRVARVQELASQLSRGSYAPNAQAIADAIIDAAMIDAELEAAGR